MKKRDNKIIILGSGTSTGTPMIGCSCPVCRSPNPKNRRLRTSIYVQTSESQNFLVDTSPDLRHQLLSHNITQLDFVLITHDHADHLHGIDDLRPINFIQSPPELNIYVSTLHHSSICQRFPYIFNPQTIFSSEKPVKGGGIPRLLINAIDLKDNDFSKKQIHGVSLTFFLVPHNYTKTLCFIHKSFAYIPDCHSLPPSLINCLKKQSLDLLIIDCLRFKHHDTHLNVDAAFHAITQIAPKRAGLIHMNHDLEHEHLLKLAQDFFDFPVFPVYDGQELSYPGEET